MLYTHNCPSLRLGQFGGQKSLGPLEKTLEIADYMFCLHKKITSRTIRTNDALIVKMLLFILFNMHTTVSCKTSIQLRWKT